MTAFIEPPKEIVLLAAKFGHIIDRSFYHSQPSHNAMGFGNHLTEHYYKCSECQSYLISNRLTLYIDAHQAHLAMTVFQKSKLYCSKYRVLA
jgi:hypothetical protein